METSYTGHNDEHVAIQSHSIGDDYPWTISAKHGPRGISYYPWNTITGEHGPRFHVDGSRDNGSEYKLSEIWIRNRKIKDLRANESALARKRANVERLANESTSATLVEYTFLIPILRDSDREPHEQRANDRLADRLYSCFGGYSIAGNVTGTWKDSNGETCFDVSTVYRVAIVPEHVHVLRGIITECKTWFDQRTVYFANTSTDCTIE